MLTDVQTLLDKYPNEPAHAPVVLRRDVVEGLLARSTALVVGRLRISHLSKGRLWLSHSSGEGMETTEERLGACLEEFFSKEF